MRVYNLPLGEMGTNCYIVDTEVENSGKNIAFAVDIGDEPEKVLKYITNKNLDLQAILLTHGHFDHIGGVRKIQDETSAKVYVSQEDSEKLTDSKLNLSYRHFQIPEIPDYEILGESLEIGGVEIKVLKTPGHTKGSVCFQVENYLFSGDTLFQNSIGRTDFPDGDLDVMRKSLKVLKDLPGDYQVLPGHGIGTTLQREREMNRYLRQI
jgi:glyoxylase-like metal-dependent hydrolase (beta-lactamase superfamily II)